MSYDQGNSTAGGGGRDGGNSGTANSNDKTDNKEDAYTRCSELHFSRTDMNMLIMNYLVTGSSSIYNYSYNIYRLI